MDVFIVLDNCAVLGSNANKCAQAGDIAATIVDSMNKKDVFVHLVVFKMYSLEDGSEINTQILENDHQINPFHRDLDIVGRYLQRGDQIKDLLKNIPFVGSIDYKILSDYFIKNHPIQNYEIILITDASLSYYPLVNDSCCPPALVRFFIIGNKKEDLNLRYLETLNHFAVKCSKKANLYNTYSEKDLMPICACDFSTTKSCVEQISNDNRVHSDITITISPSVVINAQAFPGIPKSNMGLYGFEKYIIPSDENIGANPNFNLIGFTKHSMLLNVESCRLMHSVRPPSSKSSFFNTASDPKNLTNFHLMAECLGTEGQVAILKHNSGEEAFLKPIRDEITQPWRLVLQFYPSHRLNWILESKVNLEKKKKPLLLTEKNISYKMTNYRTYWHSKECTQSDLSRLVKHLKRADRIESFYTDLRRMAKYGIATGIESFGKVLADVLEKKKLTFVPENRPHADKVVHRLRTGGWKSLLSEIGTGKI